MDITIPTKKYTIEGVEVEIAEWLTQEQEDAYNSIIMGNEDMEVTGGNIDNVTMKINLGKIAQGRKYLVETMCKNITWEQFNASSPKFREAISAKIEEVRSGIKK